MIIEISISTKNFDYNGIFYQRIYFESNHSPSKEEVLQYLRDLDEQDSKFLGYDYEWQDCIYSVNNTLSWPKVTEAKTAECCLVNRTDLFKYQSYVQLWIKIIPVRKLS